MVMNQNDRMFNIFYVFAASIFAKCTIFFYSVIASTATYPIIVARTIMQDSRSTGDSQHVSIKDVFKDVYEKRGIKGFYAGLRPDLLRILPSNTIVFVVYELIKRRINIADTLSD